MPGLTKLLSPSPSTGEIYGVVVGTVTDNKDPQKLGRVLVKFPWLSAGENSAWARIAAPMAGKGRGFYCLPDIDDEVLVAFEHGQVDSPYILGALWNGQDLPPISNEDGKNNQRLLRSRSGHEILLDDTEGEEKIVVRDSSGKNTIIIDTKQNSITLQAEQDLAIAATGNITLKSSNGDVAIAGKNVTIEAQQNFEFKATSQGNLQAQAGMAIKCLAGVKINDGALEVT